MGACVHESVEYDRSDRMKCKNHGACYEVKHVWKHLVPAVAVARSTATKCGVSWPHALRTQDLTPLSMAMTPVPVQYTFVVEVRREPEPTTNTYAPSISPADMTMADRFTVVALLPKLEDASSWLLDGLLDLRTLSSFVQAFDP